MDPAEPAYCEKFDPATNASLLFMQIEIEFHRLDPIRGLGVLVALNDRGLIDGHLESDPWV